MGDVGHKLAAAGLALGNGVGHGVEGLGQLAHLVLPLLIALHPHLVLAVAEFAGGLGDLLQGVGQPQGGDGAGDESHAQYHHGGKEKDGDERLPQLGDVRGLRRHIGHADHGLLGLPGGQVHRFDRDGGARHKAFLRKQAAQSGHTAVAALLLELADDGLGQIVPPQPALDRRSIGTEYQLPIRLGDQDKGVGDVGHIGNIELVGHVPHVDPFGPHLGGEVGHIIGVALHGVSGFPDCILVGQADKGGPQQGEGDENHPRRQQELPSVQALHAPLTTSNL